MQLIGRRGWAPLCSTASVLWLLQQGCVCYLYCGVGVAAHTCSCLSSLSCFTASLAAMGTAYRERSWVLPFFFFFLTLHPLQQSLSAPSRCIARGVSAYFARLPRHNNRIPIGDTQRRLPTWKMLGWCMFWVYLVGLRPAGFLFDGAQRCFRCFYVSPWFGNPPSHQEIHDPFYVPLSSCPQHRLQRAVKAAPPPSPKRSRTAPERRWGHIVCNVKANSNEWGANSH